MLDGWMRRAYCNGRCADAAGARGALGHEGTQDLSALLASSRAEWTDEVLTTAVDRFERRLTTEISAFRVDVLREFSMVRAEIAREVSTLLADVTRGISTLRADFTRDLLGLRSELLRWSFLFCVGQVAAMAGLLAFMLRPCRPAGSSACDTLTVCTHFGGCWSVSLPSVYPSRP